MDRIELTAIEAWGRHGVLPHERELGQRFLVDVSLELDLSEAADSDDLEHTVDYGALASEVSDIVAGPPFDLIETLAHRIVEHCRRDPRVERATVTVHKPHAPVEVPVGDVSVTVSR